MKIAILGTRGIPNNYGGPETNAELLSPIFLRLKHEVTVYSPDEHPYQNEFVSSTCSTGRAGCASGEP